jgi:hypothetical protein
VTERTLLLPLNVTDESVSPVAAWAMGLEIEIKSEDSRASTATRITLLLTWRYYSPY